MYRSTSYGVHPLTLLYTSCCLLPTGTACSSSSCRTTCYYFIILLYRSTAALTMNVSALIGRTSPVAMLMRMLSNYVPRQIGKVHVYTNVLCAERQVYPYFVDQKTTRMPTTVYIDAVS